MTDAIYESFLARQLEEGLALAAQSDILELCPQPGDLPHAYIAGFHCRGLVREENGNVMEGDRFAAGIRFPRDYLRRAEPFEVLTWLGPKNVWHPNISDHAPAICVGRLAPGTDLVDLLYQVFEIITYNKVTMREDDALNWAACEWARANQHRFPVDKRPLKRRPLGLRVSVSAAGEATGGGESR